MQKKNTTGIILEYPGILISCFINYFSQNTKNDFFLNKEVASPNQAHLPMFQMIFVLKEKIAFPNMKKLMLTEFLHPKPHNQTRKVPSLKLI